MSEIILLVFEGRKAEPQILYSIEQHFFTEQDNTVVHAIFGTVIYKLYKDIVDDPDLDLIEVLRESSVENAANLAELERDNVAEIYLFFDHDGHASNAKDSKLTAMLEHFNQETESGKLYVSYPMVESLKDHHSQENSEMVSFKDKVVKIADNQGYKALVSNTTMYRQYDKLTLNNWANIVEENDCKANFIVNGCYIAPDDIHSQADIFIYQQLNFIQPQQMVAVLSAFPFFILEYFGRENYLKRIN